MKLPCICFRHMGEHYMHHLTNDIVNRHREAILTDLRKARILIIANSTLNLTLLEAFIK